MKLTEAELSRLKAITAKRSATIISHILEHGYITSDELKEVYGYKHPPRAARDVRELGINLQTGRTKSTDGRSIAKYSFGSPVFIDNATTKKKGRTALSKALKQALVAKYGAKCFVYYKDMEERLLQVDHRIPYEIGGEPAEGNTDCYMLLSPSANRAKSWTCEHCPNWTVKDPSVCKHCFWAYPESYTHVAGQKQRQIILTFTDDEVESYQKFIDAVGIEKAEETIKRLINEMLADL